MNDWLKRHSSIVIGVILVLAFLFCGYALRNASIKRRQSCQDVETLKTIRRHELERQIRRGRAYLREHPNGAPGISRALIKQSIADERDSVRQLAAKDC